MPIHIFVIVLNFELKDLITMVHGEPRFTFCFVHCPLNTDSIQRFVNYVPYFSRLWVIYRTQCLPYVAKYRCTFRFVLKSTSTSVILSFLPSTANMATKFVLFTFVFLPFSSALYFHIGETERKCFIEEIPDETMVVGMWTIKLRHLLLVILIVAK